MNDVTFRPAAEDDLPSIVAMLANDDLGRQREGPSTPLHPKYLVAFAAIDRDSNQILAVVEDDGVIVGCLQLTFIPGLSRLGMWRGQIESVRVATGNRGKGLGPKMFEWAIAECGRRGCGLVVLTTDKSRMDAHQFYEALGLAFITPPLVGGSVHY